MTKRRLQLVAPRSGEIALNLGRAVSGNTAALLFAAFAAVGLVLMLPRRASRRPAA